MNVIIDSMIRMDDPPIELKQKARKLNTHTNPKYRSAIEQGRSTYGIDRTISDFREQYARARELSIPRGCLPLLELEGEIDDQRKNVPVEMQAPLSH